MIRIFLFALLAVGSACSQESSESINRTPLCQSDVRITYLIKSIGATKLDLKANELLNKISNNQPLTENEDIELIMMMNTVNFSGLDVSDTNLNKCHSLQKLSLLFEDSYFQIIQEKYNPCARFSTLKFKKLKIGYLGNPSECSRYKFSVNPNDDEQILIEEEIKDPEKIQLE